MVGMYEASAGICTCVLTATRAFNLESIYFASGAPFSSSTKTLFVFLYFAYNYSNSLKSEFL